VKKTLEVQDPDSLSDEDLLKLYREKKLAKNVAGSAPSQNAGAVSFSSAQNFAGEKRGVNPFHIAAAGRENEDNRNQKNIVDLKS